MQIKVNGIYVNGASLDFILKIITIQTTNNIYMKKIITESDQLKPKGIWTFEVREDKTGELVQKIVKENLVPTIGLSTIAAQFGNTSTTKDIGDNQYIALGDDNTTPSAGDTTLGNETVRKAVSDRNSAGAVATIAVFFASGEATGTHEEVGLFGDGNTTGTTSSADTGILFSHTLLSVTITASQNLTITYTLNFTT